MGTAPDPQHPRENWHRCAAAQRNPVVRAFNWLLCQLVRGHDERLFMIGRDQDLWECQRCGMYHGRQKRSLTRP